MRVMAPFGGGIEVKDNWTARILAVVIPFVVILCLIVILCFLMLGHNVEMAKINAAPTLKWD